MRYLQRQKPPLGARIDWSHPLSRGLVGCWLFNEGRGNELNNLVFPTESSNNGMLWSSCRYGVCLESYNLYKTAILAPSTDKRFNVTDELTLAALVFLEDKSSFSTSDQAIIAKWSSTGYMLHMDSSGGLRMYINTNYANYLVGFSKWMTAVGSWDGNTIRLFVNGELKASSQTTIIDNPNYELAVGRYSGQDTRSIYGKIVYAYMWKRALSAEEIKLLHQDPYCFIKTPMQWYDKIVSAVYASSTVSDAYKILTYLEKLLSDQYSILNFISTQQPDIYKILNYTSNFIADSYQLLNFTAKLQSDAYTLFNYTSQTTIDVYTIYNFASNLIQDIYSIAGLITKTLSDLYSILQYSSQTTTDTYSIFTFTQQSSSDTYTIYNYAKQQIQDLYNILNYAGSELRDIYNILQTLEKLLDDSYSIYNFAKQFVNDEYKIYNYAAGKITDYYSILVEQIVREVIVLKSEITREITRKSRILRDIILRSRLI